MSFFRLLRNSSKKSTANQTGLYGFLYYFGKGPTWTDNPNVARSAMALQRQRLIGWCHSHPFGFHIVARFGLIDRSRISER